MSTPVPESISSVIVARLESITEANGYAFDVSEVVKPDRHGEQPRYRHLSIIVEQGPSVRAFDLDYPGNPPAIAYTVTFTLSCIVRNAGTGDTESRTVNDNTMHTAAWKAIRQGNDWYSFSGYAVIADIGDATPFDPADGEFTGCRFEIPVTYRVSEDDPTEVRA